VGSFVLHEPAEVPPELTDAVLRAEEVLFSGRVDAGLGAGTATRLHRALEVVLGRLPAHALGRGSPADGVLAALSDAISELSRPIDAIKHQAKTVTVGISRGEAREQEGAVLRAVRELGFTPDDLAPEHLRFVSAFEPLVSRVQGATLYAVDGLDALGRPTEAAVVRVVGKTGCAREIPSRSEDSGPLLGTKWGVLKEGEFYLGLGKTDGRRILILPFSGRGAHGSLALLHVEIALRGRRESRMRALRAHPRRLEALRVAVTERNVPWGEELVDAVSNDSLFLENPDSAAEEIAVGVR
jgi:glucosamine--fructose-6-phosphate aminotransferase (isomerizing)